MWKNIGFESIYPTVEDLSYRVYVFNILWPSQNGHRFANDTFKRIFVNENVRISIKISLKFVPKGPFDNIPALVQIMAWRRSCDKPLSEPMMVGLLTHICVTRPQWVNGKVVQRWTLLKMWVSYASIMIKADLHDATEPLIYGRAE